MDCEIWHFFQWKRKRSFFSGQFQRELQMRILGIKEIELFNILVWHVFVYVHKQSNSVKYLPSDEQEFRTFLFDEDVNICLKVVLLPF